MNRKKTIALIGSLCLACICRADITDIPENAAIPDIKDATLKVSAVLDGNRYQYNYLLRHSETGTGGLNEINLDISRPPNSATGYFSGFSFKFRTIEPHYEDFASHMEWATPFFRDNDNRKVVTLGFDTAQPWSGHIQPEQELSIVPFSQAEDDPIHKHLEPGESLAFTVESYYPPALRNAWARGMWQYHDEDHEVDDDELAQWNAIEARIRKDFVTLGPAPYVEPYHGKLIAEFNRLPELGWLTDSQLHQQIGTHLASADAEMNDNRFSQAKAAWQQALDLVLANQARFDRAEGFYLLKERLALQIRTTGDTTYPASPRITATPEYATQKLGQAHTVELTVEDENHSDTPMDNYELRWRVVEGPNRGQEGSIVTDDDGKAHFSYTSLKAGLDTIDIGEFEYLSQHRATPLPSLFASIVQWLIPAAQAQDDDEVFDDDSGEFHFITQIKVNWAGAPDLAVPLFIPPMLESKGGNTVYLTDITVNQGDVNAAASENHYFISPGETFDTAKAQWLHSRQVPILTPGEMNRVTEYPVTLPTDLPAGRYSLAACADAPKAIVELDETNNCSFSKLDNIHAELLAVDPDASALPDCSNAQLAGSQLWPPNHKARNFSIAGIVDHQGNPLTAKIIGIEQNEPVNCGGDGNTAPDAGISGNGHLWLRAERRGNENGRVYRIKVQGEVAGQTCESTLYSSVTPHDQGKELAPSVSQWYDSTRAVSCEL